MELKPCPFCGSPAKRVDLTEPSNKGGSIITCKKCWVSTRVFFGRKEGLEEAWNMRELNATQPVPTAITSPEILAFAANMQREMDANAHKETPGNTWKELSLKDLEWGLNEFEHHRNKLMKAVHEDHLESVREHIGDLANNLMFLARMYSIL